MNSKLYKDLSTIIICPTRGYIHFKVVDAWMHFLKPINQKIVGPIFKEGLEVGDAYNELIQEILINPYLAQFNYVLTLEDDIIPPVNGLLKLYENIDNYDAVGGLYYIKGDNRCPMIFGDPKDYKKHFRPQQPIEDGIVPANAIGMGFTLFKLDMFRKVEYPWFKTVQEYIPNIGNNIQTQDVYFFNKAGDKGFKFAVDCRVKVGHYNGKENKIY